MNIQCRAHVHVKDPVNMQCRAHVHVKDPVNIKCRAHVHVKDPVNIKCRAHVHVKDPVNIKCVHLFPKTCHPQDLSILVLLIHFVLPLQFSAGCNTVVPDDLGTWHSLVNACC